MSAYVPYLLKDWSLPIIDRMGRNVGHREIHSPAAPYLFPKDKFVLVDWKTGFKDAPTAELMLNPIKIQMDLSNGLRAGTKIVGYYGWGSAAKNGITIGCTRDFLKEGIGAGPVDGQRAGRAYFSNAIHGAVVGTLYCKIVPSGTWVDGVGQVEDGFDYYDAKLVETANEAKLNARIVPQTPEDARDTYATDERVPLEKKVTLPDGRVVWQSTGVWEEFLPVIQNRVDALTIQHTPTHDIQFLNSAHQEWKANLLKIEPLLADHPFIAKTLQHIISDKSQRLASSLPKDSKVRVAVPTKAKVAALPIGKYILHRMPPTAWGTIQAHDIQQQNDEEIARIADMGVAQTTIVNPELMAKGQGGIVIGLKDRTGYDVILCADNIKMAGGGRILPNGQRLLDKKAARKQSEIVLENCYFGIIAQVAPGHSIGVDAPTMKKMKGDYDGDIVYVTDCARFPALFAVVSEYPEQEAEKLPKPDPEWKSYEDRPRVLAETMDDVIGFMTNLLTLSFASTKNRDQFAHDAGWTGLSTAMDNQLSFLCQIGEDLFKTDLSKIKSKSTGRTLSLKAIHAEGSVIQTAMRRIAGKMAPWSAWTRDPDAFKTMIPEVYNEGLMGHLEKDSSRVRNSVPPSWDSTIARIAQYVLPQLETIIKDTILVRPLTEFQGWATMEKKELLAAAEKFQLIYEGRSMHLNWSDRGVDGDVREFQVWLEREVEAFLRGTGATRQAAANALWYVAHATRAKNAGASSVFMAFPDEVEYIVRNKPGLSQEQTHTVVLGLNPLVNTTRVTGEIIEMEINRVIAKAFVPDNKAILKDGNRYAGIPKDHPQLRIGKVVADIKRRDKSSWHFEVVSRP